MKNKENKVNLDFKATKGDWNPFQHLMVSSELFDTLKKWSNNKIPGIIPGCGIDINQKNVMGDREDGETAQDGHTSFSTYGMLSKIDFLKQKTKKLI